MNTVLLNTVHLDGAPIVKKGSGGGGMTINNQSKSVEITENGTTEIVADSGYTGLGKVTINTNVASSGGGGGVTPKWTGHADVEGLKAIGWTDEDIAYYQENGVNWNAEDDEYHKVTDDNKALYGVITAQNLFWDVANNCRSLVYLPKINDGTITSLSRVFQSCMWLVAIPMIDTHSVTNMREAFADCYALTCVPPLDTSNVTNMYRVFYECSSLTSIPQLDTSNVTDACAMFEKCYRIRTIPQLNTSKVTDMSRMFYDCSSLVAIPTMDTSNVTNMRDMFVDCKTLVSVPRMETSKVTDFGYMFQGCRSLVSIPQFDVQNGGSPNFSLCYNLTHANIKNVKIRIDFRDSKRFSKESLLYIINNESSTSAFTITINEYLYPQLSIDADVVNALSNHPNVSLASGY